MRKKILAVLSCVLILLFCISAMVACRCNHNFVDGTCSKCGAPDPDYTPKCDHVYVDGICTKCGEADPNYVAPKKDYDMSGVKFENKTVVYSGQKQTMSISGTLPQGVTVAYAYYSDEQHTVKADDTILPGTYYVVASFNSNAEGYNPIPEMKATLTITKKDYNMSGVKLENKIAKYTGEKIALEITGTLPQGVTVTYVYATDSEFTNTVTEMVNTGTYYVKASFTGEVGYHDIDDMTATLRITLLDLDNIALANNEVNYNGEAHSLEITGEVPTNISVSYKFYTDEACENEVAEMVNAGVYYVKATLVANDNTANKEELVAKLTIKKIDVAAIEFKNATVEYDGQAHTIAITGELPTGAKTVEYKYFSDEACTTEVAEANVVNAGTYYVKAIFTVDANHNDVADRTATLTITKKAVAVTFANQSVDYNGEAQAITINELPEEVTNVTYTYYSDANYQTEIAQTEVVNAGVYYVIATFTTDDNHVAESQRATLTVNKAPFADIDENNTQITLKGAYDETSVDAVIENGAYTFEYTPDRVYEITATVADMNGITATVEFFRDSALTDKFGDLTKPSVTNFTDTIYMRATYSDDNHETVVVKTIKMRKFVVELKTFEDLSIMRDHIYGNTAKNIGVLSNVERRGIRYVLANDIDCNNQIWTPVSYVWSGNLTDNSFCSEFDGQGHTISNYKITQDSFDANVVASNGSGMLFVGFFGFVNNGGSDLLHVASIHDLTISNARIKLDAKDPNWNLGTVAIFAGTLIGRLDAGNSQVCGRTDLYNINVNNCAIDIDAYKQHTGGIIGVEYTGYSYVGARKNINISDSSVYAISSQGATNTVVFVGGLIGRYVGANSDTPDPTKIYWVRYYDCNVTNLKLGYNYEAWAAADAAIKELQEQPESEEITAQIAQLTAERDGHLHVMGGNIYAGAFIGSLEMNITMVDCKVENYLIGITSPGAFFTGYYGQLAGASRDMALTNTTVTQDTDWNNGINGVYGGGQTKLDENEVGHEAKWNASIATDNGGADPV